MEPNATVKNEEKQILCHKCNNTITNRLVSAMGKTWHPQHFLCLHCEKAIIDTTFNIQDGEPVCTNCFMQLYVSPCAACKQPILERTVCALGETWHEDCFVCDGACRKALSNCAFYERDGKVYCKKDYEDMFTVRCAKCEMPIDESAIIAMNAKWHRDCFRCNRCENPIYSQMFTIEGDKPVCLACTY